MGPPLPESEVSAGDGVLIALDRDEQAVLVEDELVAPAGEDAEVAARGENAKDVCRQGTAPAICSLSRQSRTRYRQGPLCPAAGGFL